MAKGALFVRWGEIIAGREKAAQTALGNAMQYCMRLQREGRIDSFEVVSLELHGGELMGFVVLKGDKEAIAQLRVDDLMGFVLLKGDKEAIAQLRVDDEFVSVIVGVQLVHRKVGVVGAYMGAEMQLLFAMWDEQEERLL